MVWLPDTNFKQKLIDLGLGECIVGHSIDSTCPLVASTTELNLNNSGNSSQKYRLTFLVNIVFMSFVAFRL